MDLSQENTPSDAPSGARRPVRSSPSPGAARNPGRWRKARGWTLASVAIAVVFTFVLAGRTFPYLPRPLELIIVFPQRPAERIEPILSTGQHGRADFLNLHYGSETTAVLEYAAWGPDGPSSEPFTFEPGRRYSLVLDLPSLDYGGPWLKRQTRPMRVTLDGKDILNSPVIFYPRKPEQVYFGLNPIGGGKTDGIFFSGELMKPDGTPLLGGPESYFSFREQLATWVLQRPRQVLLVVLGSVALGFGFGPVWRWGTRTMRSRQLGTLATHPTPPHRAFAAAAMFCALAFGALVTQGTFDFLHEESFGSFYDHQALSMLKGRLDVPRDIIGGEAFIVDGKSYGYYGITPALLRLPFAATGIAMGKLSRAYMFAYYVASLIAGYLLLCHAARLAGGRRAWPSAAATMLFTLSIGLGSTLLFLGARAYVYHEAILCGAVFALWAVYCGFRYLEAPTSRWCWMALLCGLLAVQARPSSGLFALCVLGTACLWQIGTHWRGQGPYGIRRHLAIGVLATLAILSFNGMSYLKFGTFDGSPFRYAVQYTPERIARFDGRNFHLSNVPRNLDTYLFQPDIALRARFPFIFLDGGEERTYAKARIDYSEQTLALPYAMPALFSLATLGAAWAAWRCAAVRPALIVLLVGFIPMALALVSAIVTSHRYTADFCPFLMAAAALGLAVVDAETRRLRRVALTVGALLTAVAIAVNVAISIHFQGEVTWGVPEQTRQKYESLRRGVEAFFGIK